MLEEFYRKNYPIVYGYLLSLCHDPHLAEDLTSDVFSVAIEKIDTYDPKYRASTWLCTIGRNLLINYRKRQRRIVPLTEDNPIISPSPEVLYIQKEQAKEAMRAAEKLPVLQRQVVYMRWEGMQFRDIALSLGQTENWARVTYYRAKVKILAEMEENI